MRKALLAVCAVLLLASFATDKSEKVILKDIDGTLLQSYVVIDDVERTVTLTVDVNTTVSSSIIDGETKIFLVDNGNSNETVTRTLKFDNVKDLSFTNYMNANFDVASGTDMFVAFTGHTKPKTKTE